MGYSEDTRDDRFAQDADRVLAGQPVAESTDKAYQADLDMVHLLSQVQFVSTPQFKSRLRSRLISKLDEKEVRTMSPVRMLGSIVRPVLVAGLAAIFVLAVVLALSPDVRATAQEWLTRIVIVEVDSPEALLPTPSDAGSPPAGPDMSDLSQSPGVSVEVSPPPGVSAPLVPGGPDPHPDEMLVSVEEAQAQVSFTIKLPANLPEGYTLKGAVKPVPLPELKEPLPADAPVSSLPSAVLLVFGNAEGDTLMLSESSLSTPAFGLAEVQPPAGVQPPAVVQLPAGKGSVLNVTIKGQPGQYVQGAWSPQGWNSDANHHMLHWQGADNVTYDLVSQQLGLKALLAIAESIP